MDDFTTLKEARPSKSKPAIGAEEMQRRREALRRADANNRLEGIYREAATDAVFEAHIRGEIDSTELAARLKAMPHPV